MGQRFEQVVTQAVYEYNLGVHRFLLAVLGLVTYYLKGCLRTFQILYPPLASSRCETANPANMMAQRASLFQSEASSFGTVSRTINEFRTKN
jgi:hypothetical protein